MTNFWDYSVWGAINLFAVLLLSLLFANLLKRKCKFLQKTLIPTPVLGGLLLLVFATIYEALTGEILFNTAFFSGNGLTLMEMITYHCLALGFIATSFKPSKEKMNKKRSVEVLNTGITTVATYLIQAIIGMGITIFIAAFIVKDFFPVAGLLLPFGYGQGTGQAMNYGNIYETTYGFVGGKNFGLTIAALGFLSASIGGVIHLHILKRKGIFVPGADERAEQYSSEDIQTADEIPMNGSMDKLTIQIGFVLMAYVASYFIMFGFGKLLPGLRSILYGFNFLFGVLVTVAINSVLTILRRKKIMNRQYVNGFLMDRIGGFFFDMMIVAGIAAIRLEALKNYWVILVLLGVLGLIATYLYVYYICYKLFPEYKHEQFMGMYGMLTGTACTGVILLKEVDRYMKTPASENLVYQNLPAMALGFPMMIVATMAPKQPVLTLLIVILYFVALNVFLFRGILFKKKQK